MYIFNPQNALQICLYPYRILHKLFWSQDNLEAGLCKQYHERYHNTYLMRPQTSISSEQMLVGKTIPYNKDQSRTMHGYEFSFYIFSTLRKHLKIYLQFKPFPDQAVMDLFLKQIFVLLSIPFVRFIEILLSIFYRSCNSCLFHRRCAR